MYHHLLNRKAASLAHRPTAWNGHASGAVPRGARSTTTRVREQGEDSGDDIAILRRRSLKATLATFAVGLTCLLILIALLAAFDWR